MEQPVSASYVTRRGQLETYFNRTAVEAWKRLTSDAPVSGIRATVRAGRNAMRDTLLGWLPTDLTGLRILDAGCGTGALSCVLAERGARVVAVDISRTLVELAGSRCRERLPDAAIDFRVGDMLDPVLGTFDYVIAMDSLIHYNMTDVMKVLCALTPRTRRGVLFTFAPKTPALSAMHAIGRLFPRGNRAPAIEPVGAQRLRGGIAEEPSLRDWRAERTSRVCSGFYTSQALELRRQ